jgi:hypothetical protein
VVRGLVPRPLPWCDGSGARCSRGHWSARLGSRLEKELRGARGAGHRLEPSELERLLDQVDLGRSGRVARSQLVASQMDWRAMQQTHTERWLAAATAVFRGLDVDGDGVIRVDELISALRTKLLPSEVRALRCAASPGALRGRRAAQQTAGCTGC